MGRVVAISVVDGSGAAAPGQTVVAGDFELTTGSDGTARALFAEEDTVIKVNGVTAYKGPVDALRPLEVFTAKGQRVG